MNITSPIYTAVAKWCFRDAPYPMQMYITSHLYIQLLKNGASGVLSILFLELGFQIYKTSHIYTAVAKWCFRGAPYPILRELGFRCT